MAAPAKSERFDMRLLAAHKQLIEKAAAVSGQPVTAFAVAALVERAEQVLERHATTALSARDGAAFLDLLGESKPNARLRRAARRFRSTKRD